VNFAVLPRAPCRSKNFVHVASKQVFIRSICTCCCWCKSPIDLPAASKFSLIMKSWTDQNCQFQIWLLLLLLLLLQPGESGGDHSAGGRKQKYSRRTERQLRHSGLLHLLTTCHLHSVCEHCESSSSCCCCSCLDLGIFFLFFLFFLSSCNITTWS
jgi:hypothetical protein